MRNAFLAIFLLLLVACSKNTAAPVGFRTVEEAQVAADEFFKNANPGALIRGADSSGISQEEMKAFYRFAYHGWKNAEVRKHHKWTRIVDVQGLAEVAREFKKDWPDEMKSERQSRTWNFEPELFIVYYFENQDPKSGSRIYFSPALFQRNGLWYFAAETRQR